MAKKPSNTLKLTETDGNAVRQAEVTIEQKAGEFLVPFVTKLIDLEAKIIEARASCNAWWQKHYIDEIAKHRSSIDHQAGRAIAILVGIQRGESSSEKEKELTELAKDIGKQRAAHDIWFGRTTEPIQALLREYDQVFAEAKIQATATEKKEPLFSKGLSDAVVSKLNTFARYSFDETAGRIDISTERLSAG